MPEQDLDIEKELMALREGVLAQRAEVGKMLDDCSNNPFLFDQVAGLQAACAKLDRAAGQLNWALGIGRAQDPDNKDPRRIREMQLAQYHLLCNWLDTLTAAIEALNGEGEEPEEPAN